MHTKKDNKTKIWELMLNLDYNGQFFFLEIKSAMKESL